MMLKQLEILSSELIVSRCMNEIEALTIAQPMGGTFKPAKKKTLKCAHFPSLGQQFVRAGSNSLKQARRMLPGICALIGTKILFGQPAVCSQRLPDHLIHVVVTIRGQSPYKVNVLLLCS